MTNRAFLMVLTAGCAAMFAGVFTFTGPSAAPLASEPSMEGPVYYSDCNAVRAAGKAPLLIGQPGYRSTMDGDGDGIACEPYRAGGFHGGWGRKRRRR